MASPVPDSYTCAPGSPLAAGWAVVPRHRRVSIWGQSNALGRAERADLAAAPLRADWRLGLFDGGAFDRVFIWNGTTYQALTPAVNNGCSAGQFGPEFGLAARWMRETAAGNLYIEKVGFSGVSIDYFDPAGANYPSLRSWHNAADAWLAANSIVVDDTGFLWVQGESDQVQTQTWYQTRLETLLAAMQTDGIIDASTRRLLARMHPSTATYGPGPSAAKDALAAASPANTQAFTLAYYMTSDNIHLAGRGQLQLGYDSFEMIFGAAHMAA